MKKTSLNNENKTSFAKIAVDYIENEIAIITLQDKSHKNQLTKEFLFEFDRKLFELNESVKVIIITGYDDVFCFGGGESALLAIANQEIKHTEASFIYKRFLELDVPVIAAVQGHAFGGGLSMALYADIVLLSEDRMYSGNFMKYGITPGLGSTFIFAEKLSPALANEMLFTAREYTGSELMMRGAKVIFNSSEEVVSQALSIAKSLVKQPLLYLKTLKKTLSNKILEKLPNVLLKEQNMHDEIFKSGDAKEKIKNHFDVINKFKNVQRDLTDKIVLSNCSISNNEIPQFSQRRLRSVQLKGLEDSCEVGHEEIKSDNCDNLPEPVDGDIAIIGVSGRFSGADDLDTFWENLKNGVDSTRVEPNTRWSSDINSHSVECHDAYLERGGFISNIEYFDSLFFGIAPAEAMQMDPQQRIFLEESWKALEDAGLSQASIRGKNGGVFVGVGAGDYQQLLGFQKEHLNERNLLGNMSSILPARIAYYLDLVGPAIATDTACSSSLVAIHQACQSIRSKECDFAIAGGISLFSTPSLHIAMNHLGVLSVSGQCKPFDNHSDGMVLGEGVGVIVLKPLSKALADHDKIYGVIKGSGVNQDGATNGITAPSARSQEQLEKMVYDRYQINPHDISYVEAHGTGTKLGDPIEIQALTRSFKHYTSAKQYCAVGSVKSNIGHTLSAAGVISVIKVLLCLRHKKLVPTINVDIPNEHIDFDNSPFYLNKTLNDWDRINNKPRLAAISSFGISGTNAHIVIEEAPAQELRAAPTQSKPYYLVSLSAKHEESLKQRIRDLFEWLKLNSTVSLDSLSYTLNERRNHFNHRAAWVISGKNELEEQLALAVAEKDSDRYFSDVVDHNKKPDDDAIYETMLEEALKNLNDDDNQQYFKNLRVLANLHVKGYPMDWKLLRSDEKYYNINLPSYPFFRSKYWYTDHHSEAKEKHIADKNPDRLIKKKTLNQQYVENDSSKIITVNHIDNGIAIIRLQDKLHKNQFNEKFVLELQQKLIEAQERAKVIIITGYDDVFCLGGSEDELMNIAARETDNTDLSFIYKGFLECKVPVIAAVQGHAFGAGLAMALYADIVILSEDNVYAANFMKYGITPGAGSTFIFEERLSSALANEMLFTAREYTGLELKMRGAQILFKASEEVLPESINIGKMLANKPISSLQVFKQNLSKRFLEKLPAILDEELRMHQAIFKFDHVKRNIQKHFNKVKEFGIKDDGNKNSMQLKNISDHVNPIVSADKYIEPLKKIFGQQLFLENDALNIHKKFSDLGADSISIIGITRNIKEEFGIDVESSLLYDYSTIAKLNAYLISELDESLPAIAPVSEKITESPFHLEDLDNLEKQSEPLFFSEGAADLKQEDLENSIAIIGVSGRFPRADNLDVFWENLKNGTNAIDEPPADRWLYDKLLDSDQSRNIPLKRGGFLHHIEHFDPLFFEISPAEAMQMDPQQRIFLEESWRALEDAGYSQESIRGKNCGVFVGTGAGDYQNLQQSECDLGEQNILGNMASILAARIAYCLDLVGPAIAIDTACSSSLVAIHQACQTIRSKECDFAIAGGVSVFSTPSLYISMDKLGILSANRKCKPFDNQADGILPGEGVGVIVLKPLSNALADNDRIYGVIKGSGVNQDGATNGITAPSARSQEQLEKMVYDRYQINPHDISYVEAHGTGTKLGDPIEIQALTRSFKHYTNAKQYCAIGSVKSNIGHTLAAAGVISVIKVLLCLQHRKLVPTINVDAPNEHIDFDNSPFYLNKTLNDWDRINNKPRLAAISSFGISGTNAHIIIEEAPGQELRADLAQSKLYYLITVSAKHEESLKQRIRDLSEWLKSNTTVSLSSLSYTLNERRSHFNHRAAWVISGKNELEAQLALAIAGQDNDQYFSNVIDDNKKPDDDAIYAKVLEETLNELKNLNDNDSQRYFQNLRVLANLYVKGYSIDWALLRGDEKHQLMNIPTYPFLKRYHWITENNLSGDSQSIKTKHIIPLHPLLGRSASTPETKWFKTRFTGNEPYVSDHIVQSQKIIPGVVYLEMIQTAVALILPDRVMNRIQDVMWGKPLLISDPVEVTTSLQMLPDQTIRYEISTHDANTNRPIIHSQGTVSFVEVDFTKPPLWTAIDKLKENPVIFDREGLYQLFSNAGLQYGPSFKVLQWIRAHTSEALSYYAIPKVESGYKLPIHLLDGMFQTIAGLLSSEFLMLPFSFSKLTLFNTLPPQGFIAARLIDQKKQDDRIVSCDFYILDESGDVYAECTGFMARAVNTTPDSVQRVGSEKDKGSVLEIGFGESESRDILLTKTQQYLNKMIAKALKLSEDELESNTPFDKYGIDSIMAVDLTVVLEEDFGVLPKTLFFEYRTLSQLSDYFIKVHRDTLLTRLKLEMNDNRSSFLLPEFMPLESRFHAGMSVQTLQKTSSSDIAIIGLAGRYPMANTLEVFWENLKAGKDCVIEIPKSRWDYDAFYDKQKGVIGKTYSKWGSFLEDIDKFDPMFFNISPKEAELMDPQERLFLEIAWQVLEDAGYRPDDLGVTGVFVGVMYGLYQLHSMDLMPGLSSSYASIANRISYYLNLSGPSLAIDTMCSSSLTAIHLACESIRRGECVLAIAGGVNITSHFNKYLTLSQGQFLSSDGKCKSFGEGGDGYVPGEGVGAVLLKSLDKALMDKDRILGVIKGSSVNHGGKTNGYTVPNPIAQAGVVEAALAQAQISPESISYIEAHGTGTSLGDPIEIRGLNRALEGKINKQSCAIGSIKSNLGHLESAAGIVALTKVLLQMRHKQLVPSLHSETLNSYIDFSETPFYVQQELSVWESAGPRRAGISSFGAGGSNAHLIIEEAPTEEVIERSGQRKPYYLVSLSAKHEESLKQRIRDLSKWLKTHSSVSLDAIAYTLNAKRSHFHYRCAFVVDSIEALHDKLLVVSDELKQDVSHYYYGDANQQPEDKAIYKKIVKQTMDELSNHGAITSYLENIETLANLYVKGYELDWMLLHQDEALRTIALPTYPFERQRYWIDEKPHMTPSLSIPLTLGFLQSKLNSPIREQVLAGELSVSRDYYLRDHSIFGRAIFPASGYLELCFEAISGLELKRGLQLNDIQFERALLLPEEERVSVQMIVSDEPAAQRLSVYSRRGDGWLRHCYANLSLDDSLPFKRIYLSECIQRAISSQSGEAYYQKVNGQGLTYGPLFQGIRTIYQLKEGMLAEVNLESHGDYIVHPAVLDSCIHSMGSLLLSETALQKTYMPIAIKRVRFVGRLPSHVWVKIDKEFLLAEDKDLSASLEIYNLSGERIGLIEGLRLSEVTEKQLTAMSELLPQPKDLYYVWRWVPRYDIAHYVSTPMTDSLPTAEAWLLLHDSSDFASALSDRLHKEGIKVEVISHEMFNLEKLSGLSSLSRIICIFLARDESSLSIPELTEHRSITFLSCIQCLMHYYQQRNESYPALDVMMSSRLSGGDNEACLPSSALWGMGRSLQNEYSDWSVRLLECDEGDNFASIAHALWVSTRACLDENQLRIEGSQILSCRLQSSELNQRDDGLLALTQIPEVGVYLITGGLSGIGYAVCEWLVSQGVQNIALLARRTANEAQQHQFTAWAHQGTIVKSYVVDVGDMAALTKIYHQIQQNQGSVQHVIHSAGVLADATFLNQTPEYYHRVYQAKVYGAWNLHELTRHEPLDSFVVFSSIAGLLGSPGQSNYAAANVFLDALICHRRMIGLKGLSINWGAWDEIGLAVNSVAASRNAFLKPINPQEGLRAFHYLISNADREGQVSVMPMDWVMYQTHQTEIQPIFTSLMKPIDIANAVGPRFLLDIDNLSPKEASHLVQQQVSGVLATLLHYKDGLIPDVHKAFFELGMDSLMTIDFSKSLARLFGITLSTQKLFDYPTVAQLTQYILAALNQIERAPARALPKLSTQENDSAIAVIGMSFILPSGVQTPEALSEKLKSGVSFIQDIPHSRFDIDSLSKDSAQKIYTRAGSFIDDPDVFDANYFGISPREATLMDPQIRLLLETTSEALERAHQTTIESHSTGVFIGAMNQDYAQLLGELPSESQSVMGGGLSALSGRLAYFFGAQGPTLTIDTACSSSLVSVCLAVKSLRQGECNLAIAGGVNLIFSPKIYEIECAANMLSPEGHCYTFDERANGFVRGEGVGVVILKRLSDAIAAKDNVLAVIKGVAINHDGTSMGYSVPNGQSQEQLIRTALLDAGLRPEDIHCVEAHGTGTSLGDPIELDALQATYGQAHDENNPLYVSSIKTNMGHLEGTAGIVGLIKSILQVQQGVIYPHLNLTTPTSKFDWSTSAIRIPQTCTDWPKTSIRRAGLSSFGLSGTNAHVILESMQGRDAAMTDRKPSEPTYYMLALSAKSDDSLRRRVSQLTAFISESEPWRLGDICFTNNIYQKHHEYRCFVSGESHSELLEHLSALSLCTFERVPEVSDVGPCQDEVELPISMEGVATLRRRYLMGGAIDWRSIYSSVDYQKMILPPYPFERKRYWFKPLSSEKSLPKENNLKPLMSHPEKVLSKQQRTDANAIKVQFISIFKEVLFLQEEEEIDVHKTFSQYGVDSILGVEIIKKINMKLNINIEAIALYNHPTIKALLDYLIEIAPIAVEKVAFQRSMEAEHNTQGLSDTGLIRLSNLNDVHVTPSKHEPQNHYQHSEAVAIVGVSMELPESKTLQQFWQNLSEGRNSITEIPSERWLLDDFYDATGREKHKSISKWGGFLSDIDEFDPLFFNISPTEAIVMDPQQRLFLKHCWNALEDAGYVPSTERNNRCGVYVGVMNQDYIQLVAQSQLEGATHEVTGNSNSMLAGRVAYFLNLHGPTITIDTACSSSLVAMHMGVKSLLDHEADAMLVGGVTLWLAPSSYVGMSQAGMLSAEGQCKTFDNRADGFVPGEGVGVVLLKRLSDAQRDGDHIYGVIKGSGVNQDGRTNGLMAPNGTSQHQLEKDIYQRYSIDASAIGYVETHGTGTKLGDPIEMKALIDTFQYFTPKEQYCAVGSVKSNIGHTAAAAGISSVIKVLLCLQHKMLVPSLNFDTPNEHIHFQDSPFYVNTRFKAWEKMNNQPRLAAVSSFGFSGTNAHMLIEEAPEQAKMLDNKPFYLVTLSGKNSDALKQRQHDLLAWLEQNHEAALSSVSYTQNVGRSHFDHRVAMVVQDSDELKKALHQLIAGVHDQNYFFGVRQLNQMDNNDVINEVAFKAILESLKQPGDQDKQHYCENLRVLAHLYVKGYPIDWDQLYDDERKQKISLPTYPFAKERYWISSSGGSRTVQSVASPKIERHLMNSEMSWDGLSYFVHWDVVEPIGQGISRDVERVLVVCSGAYAAIFAETILSYYEQAHGQRVILIVLSNKTEQISETSWLCDVGDTTAFKQCLADEQNIDCIYFVSMYPEQPAALLEGVFAGQEENEIQLLRLVQYLKREKKCADQVDLYLLTMDQNAVTDHAVVEYRGAGLTGLGYSIAQSHHQFLVRNIDLSLNDMWKNEDRRLVFMKLLAEPSSDRGQRMKYANGDRYQERFYKVDCVQDGDVHLREGGVYLILGGRGRIGQVITRAFMERHNANVIWIGRLPKEDRSVQEALRSFAGIGGEIHYVQGDATDVMSMRRCVQEVKTIYSKIDGAIFSGLVFNLENGIDATSEAEFRRVLEVKTKGSAIFYEVLKNEPLDFMCYFSSGQAYAFSGATQFSAYASGITFADRLVESLQKTSIFPVGVINWGFWDDPTLTNTFKRHMNGIKPEEGWRCFTQFIAKLCCSRVRQLLCMKATEEVERLMNVHQEMVFYFSEKDRLIKKAARETKMREASSVTQQRVSIDALSVNHGLLMCLAKVLKMSEEKINPDVAFSDYGVDSILGATFIQEVNDCFSISLSTTIIFEYATLRRLGEKILSLNMTARPLTSSSPPRCVQNDIERSTRKIAVVGMSGQFPKANDVDKFWENLLHGVDGVDELPSEYLNEACIGDKGEKGKSYCKWGGILAERTFFEPQFFNVLPKEAHSINPHQRLVLQEGWRALEDAGYAPKTLSNKKVGVYIGSEPNGYMGESFTGASEAVIASRLSYFLDLKGPAFVVNTGCSSSAVAIHLACESLRHNETDLVLAGGVHAYMTQDTLIQLSQIGMLSSSGRAYTFDERSDGTIISEGVGIVVLKRLEDAIKDGDPIHGVICGSGVNQDGASNGITAPNGVAQEALIEEVYKRFAIDVDRISYVEVHGVGTKLSDPVEANALVRAFRQLGAKEEQYCAIGSAKSHIGHTASAAGVVGLIKVLMSMKHERLPGLLHFEKLNSLIEFEGSPFYVNTAIKQWARRKGCPRMAAINSFGHSGTNVHLVVEEAPERVCAVDNKPYYLLTLSAKSEEALKQRQRDLLTVLERKHEGPLSTLSYTLNCGRSHFECRIAFVVKDKKELLERLSLVIVGQHDEFTFIGKIKENEAPDDIICQKVLSESFDELKQGGQESAQYKETLIWLANLYVKGYAIDWELLHQGEIKQRLSLPTYPFEKQHYWLSHFNSTAVEERRPVHPSHQKMVSSRTCEESPEVGTAPSESLGERARLLNLVQTKVIELVSMSSMIEQSKINLDKDFFQYGFDSIALTRLVADLNDCYAVELTPAALYRYSTIHQLVAHLMKHHFQEVRAYHAECLNKNDIEIRVDRVEDEASFPLSEGQKGLWFLQEYFPGMTNYNIPIVFFVEGEMNIAALQSAMQSILNRHPILQADILQNDEGHCIQQLHRRSPVLEQHIVERTLHEEMMKQLAILTVRKPFQLGREPLIRFYLFSDKNKNNMLLVNVHHIVFDAASTMIFLREFPYIYDCYCQGMEPTLHAIEANYFDFVSWEQTSLKSKKMQDDLTYWNNELAGTLPILSLPTDRPRLSNRLHDSAMYEFSLASEQTTQVKCFAQNNQVSLFTLLLGVYQILLYRYTNQDDLIVGVTQSNRFKKQFEHTIGYFVNMLPVRVHVDGNDSFEVYLERLKQKMIGAMEHACPLSTVVASLKKERNLQQKQLFQTSFTHYQSDRSTVDLDGAMQNESLKFLPGIYQDSEFDLEVRVGEQHGALIFCFFYDKNRFDVETIVRMSRHYTRLLHEIMSFSSLKINQLECLNADERRQLLVGRNNTGVAIQSEKSAHQRFEAQVERTPTATALVCNQRSISYDDLNKRANKLARYLRRQGVERETFVVLCLERGIEYVISMLGVWKAGGALVPINPDHPVAKNRSVIEQVNPVVVLTSQHDHDVTDWLCHEPWLRADIEAVLEDEAAESNLDIMGDADDLAYVIFTSGSTGKPKGAMVLQRGMLNHLYAKINDFNLTEQDNIGQTSTQTFDVNIWQCMVGLLVGAKTTILIGNDAWEPELLCHQIEEKRITIVESVPSHLVVLLDYLSHRKKKPALTTLRCFIMNGEALLTALAAKWFELYPDIPLANVYGPTECSDDVSHYRFTAVEEGFGYSIPIGKPVQNTQLYVLGDGLEVLPQGVVGELYVGGEGVGRGYLGLDEKTTESFIDNIFRSETEKQEDKNKKLYKTGDLVRWLSDGNLEYLGRRDNQVKLRGHRIELGEIECVLMQHERIQCAVVRAHHDQEMNQQLVVYYVPTQPTADLHDVMLQYLRTKLPHYMIPHTFIQLDEIPLNQNGKIDRSALPAPICDQHVDKIRPIHYVDVALSKIWSDVLNVSIDIIYVNSDFFALGGHSIKLMQVLFKIQKRFRVTLKMVDVFNNPTLSGMSEAIVGRGYSDLISMKTLVSLRESSNDDNVLVLVHPSTGLIDCYIGFAKEMKTTAAIIAIQFQQQEHCHSIESLAEAYLNELMTHYPCKAYHFVGYSLGGYIAFEMAKLLEQRHLTYASLIVVDADVKHDIVADEGIEHSDAFTQFINAMNLVDGLELSEQDRDLYEQMLQQEQEDLNRWLRSYTTSGTVSKMAVFDAAEGNCTNTWQAYTRTPVYHDIVPGNHFTLFSSNNLSRLVDCFINYFDTIMRCSTFH